MDNSLPRGMPSPQRQEEQRDLFQSSVRYGSQRRAPGSRTLANFSSAPITAKSFLPPRVPALRRWQRIAVLAASSDGIPRTIWKRVDGGISNAESGRFLACVVELHSQGYGPRKRARATGHAPALVTAKWDPRVRDAHDGRWDLVEARGMKPSPRHPRQHDRRLTACQCPSARRGLSLRPLPRFPRDEPCFQRPPSRLSRGNDTTAGARSNRRARAHR